VQPENADWVKKLPEKNLYLLQDTVKVLDKNKKEIKFPGAYWPSIYDVGTKVKLAYGQSHTSYWRLMEPVTEDNKIIHGKNIVPNLYKALEKQDPRLTKMLEGALLNLSFVKKMAKNLLLLILIKKKF
jgi:hypothetical protein